MRLVWFSTTHKFSLNVPLIKTEMPWFNLFDLIDVKKIKFDEKTIFPVWLGRFYSIEFEMFQAWNFLCWQTTVVDLFFTFHNHQSSPPFEPSYDRDNIFFKCNFLKSQKHALFVKLNVYCKDFHKCLFYGVFVPLSWKFLPWVLLCYW